MRMAYTVDDHKKALAAYFHNQSYREISKNMDIPKSTIFDWIKKVVNNMIRKKKKMTKRTCKMESKLKAFRDVIVGIWNANPFITLTHLYYKLKSKHQFPFSISSLRRYVSRDIKGV